MYISGTDNNKFFSNNKNKEQISINLSSERTEINYTRTKICSK